MKVAILSLLALVAFASANLGEIDDALENGMHPLSAEMVELINQANTTWKAKQHFTEKDFEDVKTRMGAILDFTQLPKHYNDDVDMTAEIPAEFDSRKNWPACKDIVNDIRDQANCGSCWAVSATSAMSDRICIASNGQKKVKVSADDLLSCCTLWNSFSFCGFGCNGGIIQLAWRYWVKKGIVSGGNFDENDTCRPYELKPCTHHTDPKTDCSGNSRTPKCKRQCVNGADYKKDKFYGKKYYSVRGGEEAIQREILTNGPVQVGFTVMSDFPQYESGVYQATSNNALGGHAVKIIGWGVEDNVKFWKVVNSWGPAWGDKADQGTFKFIRGVNHCGMESQVVAGLPKL